jgi:hypothetical protein
MSIKPKSKITFAQTEREKIREHFIKRAREAPIVSPLDPSSMEAWWDYGVVPALLQPDTT